MKIDTRIINMLEKVCVLPMKTVLQICETKETDKQKLMAIQVFCLKTLEVLHRTIEEQREK